MKYGGVGLKRPEATYLYLSIDGGGVGMGAGDQGMNKHSVFNSIQFAQAAVIQRCCGSNL